MTDAYMITAGYWTEDSPITPGTRSYVETIILGPITLENLTTIIKWGEWGDLLSLGQFDVSAINSLEIRLIRKETPSVPHTNLLTPTVERYEGPDELTVPLPDGERSRNRYSIECGYATIDLNEVQALALYNRLAEDFFHASARVRIIRETHDGVCIEPNVSVFDETVPFNDIHGTVIAQSSIDQLRMYVHRA